jgi:hypothetical protein
MPQFDRVVEVIIETAGSQQALSITDLRVDFHVKKVATNDVNTARVDIFNMSPDQRAVFRSIAKNVLTLKAGYADATGPEVLFRGDITLASVVKTPPNVITRLECGDGTDVLLDTRVSLSYKEGASAKQILRDILKKIPLAEKSGIVDKVIDAIPDTQYGNGFAASGEAKKALDVVTDKLGLEWSVQDQELKVVEKGGVDGTQAILISKTTGMIEAPERSLNIVKASKKRGITEDRPGWTVKSLLLPFAEPGGVVQIEADEIPNGSQFRIESVEHQGDLFGNDWTSELDVTDIQ